MKSFGFRCGYMAGNRSRFSKYYMTGSPVFSINFSNQSIKNSQAILKCFIDLKSRLVYAGLRLQIYKVFQDRLTILNRHKQARNQDFKWGGGGVLTRPKWTQLPLCIFDFTPPFVIFFF